MHLRALAFLGSRICPNEEVAAADAGSVRQILKSSSEDVQRGAVISECGNYRYAITRLWDVQIPGLLFIGLNPSTADADSDDPTLRRCMRFAESWGYGGVIMANLFAFRATNPGVLRQVPDPVGPDNDHWLGRLRAETELAVAAWGHSGTLHDRAHSVAGRLGKLYCLGRTKTGAPRHPLYVRGTAQLLEWTA